jgi:hypothetical protein
MAAARRFIEVAVSVADEQVEEIAMTTAMRTAIRVSLRFFAVRELGVKLLSQT